MRFANPEYLYLLLLLPALMLLFFYSNYRRRKNLESYLISNLLGEEKKNIKNVVTGKIFRRSDDGRDEE